MGALLGLATVLDRVIAPVLTVGRWLGAFCMGAMAVVILAQVFFRYVLGSALAWPEETARFLMLWSMGLMAASAYRRGGFVAIDMIVGLLPRRVAALIAAVLVALNIVLLAVAARIGWGEVTGITGRFATDSMWIWAPWLDAGWFKLPKAAMSASLLACVALLLAVAVELLVRSLVHLLGSGDRLPVIPDTVTLGAE
jgi:TRAP-type C4-dicarboxylate transport system permease small subunit